MGSPCPRDRQTLSGYSIASPQKENLIELALLSPLALAPVLLQFLVAQHFDALALPPRMLKDHLLLIAQSHDPHEFGLQFLPLASKSGFQQQRELHLGRSCPRREAT